MKRLVGARFMVPVVLLAAVVGTGIPVTLLYQENLATQAAESNEKPASSAAKARLERILSYRADTIDQDLAAAKAATTGEFANQFATTADQVITQAAREARIDTKATVVSIGVMNANPDKVVVLAFVNQTTTSKDKPEPKTNTLRLRVSLDSAGGQWLVAKLAQV